MSSTGIIVGSIVGGLAFLAIVAAIAFLHFRHSGGAHLVGRIKSPSSLHSGLPAGNRSNASPGQTSKLEVLAKAVQTLEQAKQVIARFLDVLGTCITDDQEEGELVGILKALVGLDGRVDSALVLLHERVASTESNPQQPLATEELHGNLVAIGSLLDNLSGSTKHIVAQVHSSIETEHPDIVDSIRSAVQDFAAVNKLCIEEIIATCGLPGDGEPPDEVEIENLLGIDARHRDPGPPNRSPSLDTLARESYIRFGQLGRIVDLEQSIIYQRDGLELRPPGHPNRSTSLMNLANTLYTRFQQLGQMADLEQSIIYQRDALEQCSPGHPARSTSLGQLADALFTRFEQLGQMADLQQSIIYQRDALKLRPLGHPHRSTSLAGLANALFTRFEQLSQMVDLEQSIIYHRDALELRPPGHLERSTSLGNLANALKRRFDQLGQMADLQQSIIYYRDALELGRPGHPHHFASLNNLANALRTRFEQLGQMADLEQSIIYYRDTLELRPPGHPDRSTALSNLANALRTRFERLGRMADLEQSIIYYRDILELGPPGHPDRPASLNNLANALQTRFAQLGQMADLEQAIIYYRDSLELCPPGHPDRSNSLGNLAYALFTRCYQLGLMADLEQSIIYQRDALELRPSGHTHRSTSLDNLAIALFIRFEQWGQMADLEQSIIYQRDALELRPPGHPDRSNSLGNLAIALQSRFERLGQMADLEQSIIYQRDALELRPPGRPDRPAPLANLANALRTRFEQLGQMADLEQSIIYQRDALELCPPGHPHRSDSLNSLATALQIRFEQLGQMADVEEAVELLQSGADDTSDTPARRYHCACDLVDILTKHNQVLLLDTYELALNLLQLVLTVYPDVELRRKALSAGRLSPTLVMSAAAHAIGKGQPEKAVEMLEQGRGMLYSNFRGYRQPVEAVRQYNSALADRFKATSEELEALATSSLLGSDKLLGQSSHESMTVSEARWKRQRELNLESEDIIQQIRRLPGHEHFLKAVPFSDLQNAAAEGPVIIVNVAELRSDAIILHQGEPPIILPMHPQNGQSVYLTFLDLSKQLFEGRGKDGFSRLLEKTILKKLDELLVTPVLEKLESLHMPKKSRIWWCPTSALCALPIHAAGKLPNKYISSYTPTLSALISARKVPAVPNASESNPSLLAIVYPGHPPKTKDEHDDRLHTVDEEYEVIKTAAQAGQGRDVVRPDPTREAALAQLLRHRWVHFACHGRLNTSEPFQSAFELQNYPLSLSDVLHARLPNADFAFLAACDSATSGGTTDTPDESLHLAAAVQFCGIRSVVGTLWPMADVDGPRVAEVFYKHMFKGNDSRKSAEALHKVITTMRHKTGPWEDTMGEGEPLQRWANYIHIGA
ncbi:hypothetical protein FIBSPDRAFT_1040863 [Athelia psychrophila]|uniref:CHAT domain-containing protein n=1 Tax=Athelia psychrophila TaxID=1759441 RepID=A0A166PPW0_9AGAM|nr:hypothetical protein FIBSPDRAFT_1040863 [Fibularhizoctonia sp. CBS 109695]